jgi:hypothetical protein
VSVILDPLVVVPPPATLLPGIEARHMWEPAIGAPFLFGGVDVAARATWPNFRVQKIDGRHARPDANDQRDPATARMGEIVRRSLLRGKTEAWQGLVRGRTLRELREGSESMLSAFAENDEGTMTIVPPASYGSMPEFTYRARVIACSVPDEQTFGPDRQETSGWERAFQLSLRLSDPRYYEAPERSVSSTPSGSSAQGVTVPLSVPFYVPGSSTALGGLVASNVGTAPAEPIFDIHGPVSDPGLVHDDLDLALLFKSGSLTVASNQVLTVDFNDRQMTLDGGHVSRDRLDWTRSNWWDAGAMGLRVGDNRVRLVGQAVGGSAFVTCRWHNARYG